MQYSGFPKDGLRVVCTATLRPDEPFVRWRIRVDVPAGLVLEETAFPLVVLRTPLEGDGSGDAMVLGLTKGGVLRRPVAMKAGSRLAGRQPGSLAAQFATCYQPRAGFYTAAYDGKGFPKETWFGRTADGVESGWRLFSFVSGRFEPGFDLVQGTFVPATGAADWRDAADLYKTWAVTQPWCARPYAQRRDLPAWMKAGPAMVRFNRTWLAEPEQIEAWRAAYWEPHFGDVPLVTAYWGWEKVESWVTPDYFPVYPSDEAFTRLVAVLRRQGCHAFPWPSGYHWTLTFNRQADGGFSWDDRARFDAVARAHAVHQRDGSLYVRQPSWLRGGSTACLCPGDPWTINWWNRDVCLPLARRGAELIQVDQVV
ncbi:MAG: DUF6259 domain-containing protein, partial [Armatimonadota bacterium]|nr:DUF6259 domain-containing protein [Armatimonadota bacterium]